MTTPGMFTSLVQPTGSVAGAPSLAGFSAAMANLMGQCCNLTYEQFSSGWVDPADFVTTSLTALTGAGSKAAYEVKAALTRSESVGTGVTPSDPGGYATVAAGFVLDVSVSGDSLPEGVPSRFYVVALRGTRTFTEWIEDATAMPAKYYVKGALLHVGHVHGGFLAAYVDGDDGATPSDAPKDTVQGSLSQQVKAAMGALPASGNPVFVTGHSLGGALAPLCALDVRANVRGSDGDPFDVRMYSLASPLVSAGFEIEGLPAASVSSFVDYYDGEIPQSFRIVHAADIVPIVPPTCVTLGPLELEFAHVAQDNEVGFCAQTGSIGDNHSCSVTYGPYCAWLGASG